MHSATLVDVEELVRKSDLYMYMNIYAVSVVVEKPLECSVEKVTHISSAAVYGRPRRLLVFRKPKDPANPYGITKLADEHPG